MVSLCSFKALHIDFFTDLKLCFAGATHNWKWEYTHICGLVIQIYDNLANLMLISALYCIVCKIHNKAEKGYRREEHFNLVISKLFN